MSIGTKALRVVVFLLGLRHRQIASILGRHGLTEEELQRGWFLVSRLTTGRLGVSPSENAALLAQLDGWENKWFPIVHAVLSTRFPLVDESVFRNLSQTSGPEVVVSVRTLLDRLAQLPLAREEGGMGEDGRAARELLERRGMDTSTIGEAEALLSRLGSIAAAETEPESTWEDADRAAEEAVWKWYLEWGGIARAAIADRRLLKLLGFLRTQSGEVTEDPDALDTQPAPNGGEPAPTPSV